MMLGRPPNRSKFRKLRRRFDVDYMLSLGVLSVDSPSQSDIPEPSPATPTNPHCPNADPAQSKITLRSLPPDAIEDIGLKKADKTWLTTSMARGQYTHSVITARLATEIGMQRIPEPDAVQGMAIHSFTSFPAKHWGILEYTPLIEGAAVSHINVKIYDGPGLTESGIDLFLKTDNRVETRVYQPAETMGTGDPTRLGREVAMEYIENEDRECGYEADRSPPTYKDPTRRHSKCVRPRSARRNPARTTTTVANSPGRPMMPATTDVDRERRKSLQQMKSWKPRPIPLDSRQPPVLPPISE